jgi:hypothetical protein
MVTATVAAAYLLSGQVANVLGAALTHPFVTGVTGTGSVVAQQSTGGSAATTLNDIIGKIFGVIKDTISPLCTVAFIIAVVAYFLSPVNAAWKQKSKDYFKTAIIVLVVFAFGPQLLALIYGFVSSVSGTNIAAPTLK